MKCMVRGKWGKIKRRYRKIYKHGNYLYKYKNNKNTIKE